MWSRTIALPRKASSYQESCQAGQEFGFYHFRVELKLTDVNVTECVTGSSPPRYLDIVRPECVPVHEERPHAARSERPVSARSAEAVAPQAHAFIYARDNPLCSPSGCGILLGLLAKIKCSICSYQFNIWYTGH